MLRTMCDEALSFRNWSCQLVSFFSSVGAGAVKFARAARSPPAIWRAACASASSGSTIRRATRVATTLAAMIRSKEVSPVETTRAVLDRIAAVDAKVNAFAALDADGAMAAARAAEAGQFRLAVLGPDRECRRGATLAAAAQAAVD